MNLSTTKTRLIKAGYSEKEANRALSERPTSSQLKEMIQLKENERIDEVVACRRLDETGNVAYFVDSAKKNSR